ncbi:glutamate--tRNA ligase [Flaviaesturariibacter flavus]|uniref:Glutamate--tRNA ligase n=1 Tax=Flaviaesturariibacter flavus TaxID=2502780 RepID=A0A4R1B8F0_9BACT|nr:glutamate--tRNA ligase [Flaviaesturariibacter flavus]TCJ13278.1 glutamate--tRNA ligase [Flaviaesturariibacter flavus]
MAKKVRVRFAPSPTGGLHLGGVRTVLYNYLFARHHGGEFVLRIEDTDQSRYVPGAEEYIYDTLEWCGLLPDESPRKGGAFGPYRQSERKELYRAFAERLVDAGRAYYAFDTPEELDAMRTRLKNDTNPTPQYDHRVRTGMRNSLTLPAEEVKTLLDAGTPHVVRIRLEPGETVTFTDMIRGEVSFDTALVDDKVLLKADGMPTYHLAVVVDDHLMEITHAFRGEEWLPSAPVHVLLWRWLFGEEAMPHWAHLPLILGPSGKLSKRDGAKYGFPVFAMNWTDPKTNELTEGFRERGFLPEAFVNLLALLGWNDGTEQELFSLEELVRRFQMEKVHKGGAQFNFEKAQWFNHEWIKRSTAQRLLPDVKTVLAAKGITAADDTQTLRIIDLVKERCTLLSDFPAQAGFFFQAPQELDTTAFIAKWTQEKKAFFEQYAGAISNVADAASFESTFKAGAEAAGIKPGELQLPLRIMLVGGKFGPPVFAIAEVIGAEETAARIRKALEVIG